MKELVCEMCGSNDIVKEDGLFVCQTCNTKYSVEEARKMMFGETVAVEGTVKIDHSSELNNLYELARRAKDTNNGENALKYYDQILIKDPNSWEAQFYVVYYRAMQCKIVEIGNVAVDLTNVLPTVFDLIKNNENEEEYERILRELTNHMLPLSVMLYNAAQSFFNKIRGALVKAQHAPPHMRRISNLMEMLFIYGDLIILEFGEEYSQFVIEPWKQAIIFVKNTRSNSTLRNFKKKDEKPFEYIDKILKYEPSYEVPIRKKRGLFG